MSKNNCFGDSGAVHALLGDARSYTYMFFFSENVFSA